MSIDLARTAPAAVLAVFLATPASAALNSYFQDFEGLDQTSPDSLADDGWLVFGNVFDPVGNLLFGYGAFPAPNGGPGFSGIDVGQGGPDQGLQQLVVYSDYNNIDNQSAGNLVQANVFQTQVITADDIGKSVRFTFDAKRGNIEAGSTALAFIRTIDPDNGFLTNDITADMTDISDLWGTFALSFTIDAGLVGQLISFGFASTATNFEGSGIFYDNVNFSVPLPAPLMLLASALLGLAGLPRRKV